MLAYISRKVRTLLTKQQSRYGKYLGIIIAVTIIVSLPLPVPGIGLTTAGIGELCRLAGIRF